MPKKTSKKRTPETQANGRLIATVHANSYRVKKKDAAQYSVPKKGNNGVNFTTLQKVVTRYNNQRREELRRATARYPGENEETLVRSGIVRPRISGGAKALSKNIGSDEQLARTIDMIANQTKRKTGASKPDVYTRRLEKVTGKTYDKSNLYLPRTKDEAVRYRFYRMLTEGTMLPQPTVERLIGKVDIVHGRITEKGVLSVSDLTDFFFEEKKLVSDMYEEYKEEVLDADDAFTSSVSKRLKKSLYKRGWITKAEMDF